MTGTSLIEAAGVIGRSNLIIDDTPGIILSQSFAANAENTSWSTISALS